MTQEEIEQAARDNWDSINGHFINGLNPYAHNIGFIEGANWVLQSENERLKADKQRNFMDVRIILQKAICNCFKKTATDFDNANDILKYLNANGFDIFKLKAERDADLLIELSDYFARKSDINDHGSANEEMNFQMRIDDDLGAGICTGKIVQFIDSHVQSVLMQIVDEMRLEVKGLDMKDYIPDAFKDGYETALSDVLCATITKKIVKIVKP